MGNTTNAPVKIYADGHSLIYGGATGIMKVSFRENNGRFLGLFVQLGDSDPANVKGWTVFVDNNTYTQASDGTWTVAFSVYDAQSTPALVNLLATSSVCVQAFFARSAAPGA
jgi:hypothetical protein